jgi:hypothetical protein
MSSEAEIIIAFLFNRSGKTMLTEAELYLPLSMELGWLSTKEAKEFVKYVINQGLLVKKDGALQPTFPLETITIPVGFTPSKQLFSQQREEEEKDNILEQVLARICSQTHQNQHSILGEITKEEREKNITPEVAACFVARKYDVDIAHLYDEVEQNIFQRK